jgi:hypothetical protein
MYHWTAEIWEETEPAVRSSVHAKTKDRLCVTLLIVLRYRCFEVACLRFVVACM